MEDLNKIIDSVKDSVAKNVAMEEEFNNKAIALRNKCVGNYNTIIADTLGMLHKLADDLCRKYSVFFNTKENFKTEHVFIEYYGGNSCGYYVQIKADSYSFRPYYYTCNSAFSDRIENIYVNEYDKDKIMKFAEILSTEDKADALLSEICELYAKLFEEVLKVVNGKNEELEKQLTSLTDCLQSSSVVKEEEDGTIEIHLNGKTYKGTVVEE